MLSLPTTEWLNALGNQHFTEIISLPQSWKQFKNHKSLHDMKPPNSLSSAGRTPTMRPGATLLTTLPWQCRSRPWRRSPHNAVFSCSQPPVNTWEVLSTVYESTAMFASSRSALCCFSSLSSVFMGFFSVSSHPCDGLQGAKAGWRCTLLAKGHATHTDYIMMLPTATPLGFCTGLLHSRINFPYFKS